MRVRDLKGWPPQWVSSGPYIPSGEAGRLVEVNLKRGSVLQLRTKYKGNEASGAIKIADPILREKLLASLQKNIEKEISEIGDQELE